MFHRVLTSVLVLVLLYGCGGARLYRPIDKGKYVIGKMKDDDFDGLKLFLQNKTTQLRDTIIIRYSYNGETCWDLLDLREDDYIKTVLNQRQSIDRRITAARPGMLMFSFREPGNNFNKLIRWDTRIIVDSSKLLMNMLFKRRTTCGTSAIILPDRRYIQVRSDAHFEALEYTPEKIRQLLNE